MRKRAFLPLCPLRGKLVKTVLRRGDFKGQSDKPLACLPADFRYFWRNRDSARKEVAAQICVRRADTVQLRAQEIDEPTKIRIVVQRDPLRVYEVVRQRCGAREAN